MRRVPGKRRGSLLFLHRNFSYYRDKRCCDTYRCSTRRTTTCPGLLIKSGDGYILKTRHNHRGNSMTLQKIRMKGNMLKMCCDTLLQPKEIFDAVCRGNPEAAKHLSYMSMRSILNREREKYRPALPKSVGELTDVLQNYDSINLIYQGSVDAADGTMAFLFSTNVLLEALSASKELYVDGLCSVVPKHPQMSQLYTVHIRYMDKGICAVFVLCEARTTALYCAIWEKINELAPGLRENVEFTMSDYERAALNALEEIFPNADVRCCWFHFKQAVIRKWKSLGLNEESSDLLSMTTSLPLVPEDNFEEAIGILENVVNNDSNDDSKVSKFLSYIRRTWLPLASKVSVYKCRLRTNNIVESFNNIATRKLGGNHPNLWVFLNHLKTFIKDHELDLARLRNRQPVGRARSRKNVERDANIFQAQTDLASGRLPLEQFLRMVVSRGERDCTEELDASKGDDDNQAGIVDGDNANEQVICEVIINEEETSLDDDDNQAGIVDGDNANEQVISEMIIDEEETSLDGEEGEPDINAIDDNSKQKVPVKGLSVQGSSYDNNIERKPNRNKVVDDQEATIVKRALHGKEFPLVVVHPLAIKDVENEKIKSNPGNNLPSKRALPKRETPKRAVKQPVKYRI